MGEKGRARKSSENRQYRFLRTDSHPRTRQRARPESNAALDALIQVAAALLETDTFRSDELAEPLGELASQVPGSR